MRLKVRYRFEELLPAGFKFVDVDEALHGDTGMRRWKCTSCEMWVSHRHRSNQCNQCFLATFKSRKSLV